MRIAEGKCHIVFVVEEPESHERHPEEFVTDAVIRMRTELVNTNTHTVTRRTLDVEKARGQQIVRGRHPFHIADGKGTFTRTIARNASADLRKSKQRKEIQIDPNPDDPPVILIRPADRGGVESNFMAYFQVFHSLSYWNRYLMVGKSVLTHPLAVVQRVTASNARKESVAGFGIAHLDDMLDQGGGKTDLEGLRFGTMTGSVKRFL